jgi:glycosyltransferase involved in cell wall biosynthesis
MAAAIVKLLKDKPLRQRLGSAGQSLVHARFSAERMVQETLSVYQRVASQRALSTPNSQLPTPNA